jgi:hypothetical protein
MGKEVIFIYVGTAGTSLGIQFWELLNTLFSSELDLSTLDVSSFFSF